MTSASEAQLSYIAVLAGKLGLSVESAASRHSAEMPLTVAAAGKLIRQLKTEVENSTQAGTQQGAPSGSSQPGPMTPSTLRKIANGEILPPANLDADASWILYRLAKLVDVEQSLGDPVRWPGVNQGGPITVDHLIQYFGTIEAVAVAFDVSVGTAKSGWGGLLPRNRASDAEVLTRGFVKVPR